MSSAVASQKELKSATTRAGDRRSSTCVWRRQFA